MLSRESSAEAGPWRNERTPYMVEPMDAFTDPKVSDIAVVAMYDCTISREVLSRCSVVMLCCWCMAVTCWFSEANVLKNLSEKLSNTMLLIYFLYSESPSFGTKLKAEKNFLILEEPAKYPKQQVPIGGRHGEDIHGSDGLVAEGA